MFWGRSPAYRDLGGLGETYSNLSRSAISKDHLRMDQSGLFVVLESPVALWASVYSIPRVLIDGHFSFQRAAESVHPFRKPAGVFAI